ncbi:MAG: hypothetical protein K2K55_05355 [Duncaniella sp.]|nr:hypothetical protein [Duncaniella sp.]
MKTKKHLLVSTAAAARIFIKIATMAISDLRKTALLSLVAGIIEGRLDITDADFFGEAAEEIRTDLIKAISRSARARATAARRREGGMVVSSTCNPSSESPDKSTEESESATQPEANTAPESKKKRKRKHRRRKIIGKVQTAIASDNLGLHDHS